MVWSRAVIVPATAVGVPPVPPALPTATTGWPTLTFGGLAGGDVFSPEAFCSWSSATSSVTE